MIKLKKSNERKFLSGIFILVLVVGLLALSTIVRGEDAWFQGFETDGNGWSDYPAGGGILRVSSGDSGVTSSGGGWHGKLTLGPVIGGGDFLGKRWGAYTDWGAINDSAFPESGYATEIDVYLDMALANGEQKSFDFSSAVLRPGGDPWDYTQSHEFVFTIGTVNGGLNQWVVTTGTTLPGSLGEGSPVVLTETGWYTLRHEFTDDGSGALKTHMKIVNKNDEIKGSWIYVNPTLQIGVNVAGNGRGWFASNDFDGLALDNSRLMLLTEAPPEPSPNLVPETAEDCKEGSWQTFTSPSFKNQGDCVSYVQANENAEGNRKDNQ